MEDIINNTFITRMAKGSDKQKKETKKPKKAKK
jgi:hypothetical protein